MLRFAFAALFFTSPVVAGELERYCPENPDPNYGEYIVPIPLGIAHFTEEWLRYCQVHHITGESYCMSTPGGSGDLVQAGPVTNILIETDNPRIIMDGRVFIPCREFASVGHSMEYWMCKGIVAAEECRGGVPSEATGVWCGKRDAYHEVAESLGLQITSETTMKDGKPYTLKRPLNLPCENYDK